MGVFKIKIGDRFGNLKVEKIFKPDNATGYFAEVSCSCGSILKFSFKVLRRGKENCGCVKKVHKRGLATGIAILTALISSYKSNANRKNLKFTLIREECEDLFKGNCYFCGEPPSRLFKKKGIKGEYVYSGIDRINSKEGYILGNVNSCCSKCNYLKSNSSNEDFIKHVTKIYENFTKVVQYDSYA